MNRVQVVGLLLALTLLGYVFEAVRRRALLERYSLLWIFGCLCLVVLTSWPGLLDLLAAAVGVYYPPAALFLGGLFLLVLLSLHFSLAISRLTEQNRKLAQRLARLEAEEPDPR